ncbi:hypothetical protein [Nonomuraea jabiensis]|uniref:hypothetical protein n=1 Tax=Nonomuraea jabiensis TaxID=882448 RepID=UPI003D70790B
MSHALSSARPNTEPFSTADPLDDTTLIDDSSQAPFEAGPRLGRGMTASSAAVARPLDELPDGTVKIPLGLPHGAVWPVVAQVAALSQRRAGCTASIKFLADRLGIHPSTIYNALNAAGAWIITDTSTRTTRRYLAPFPEDGAWARISYRAAAGVGCRSIQGVWTPRRNRSALLELYCRLRRDEAVGAVRSQPELAEDLDVTDRTLRSMLSALEEDGWISRHRTGRMIAYRTHDAPFHAVDTAAVPDEEPPAEPSNEPAQEPTTERSRNLSRNDQGSSAETISDAEARQKRDIEAGFEKRDCSPLAVGDVQVRSDDAEDALARERQIHEDRRGTPGLPRPRGALSVMAAIPLTWQLRMSEHDRERVLAAVEKEMSCGRTVKQMTARVRRRLTVWHGIEPRRPVAVALTVIDRGYFCPHPECEDHLLPWGPCLACEEIGAQVRQQQRQDRGSGESTSTSAPVQTPPDQYMSPPAKQPQKRQEHPQQKVARVPADGPDGPAEQARALLLATCPRTAATMRAAAARKGQKLPEPARIAG